MDISKVPTHTIEKLIKTVINHNNVLAVTNGEEDRNDMLFEIIQIIKEYSKDVEDYDQQDYARRHSPKWIH